MAHIKNKGFPLQVKDEHKYTKIIRQCFNDPNTTKLDENSVVITVKIDKWGDVISGYGKIGELSYDEKDAYFELYGKDEHTTDCKLYTRTGELFGAYLSVTMTENTATKILAKNLPNAELTPKPDTSTANTGGFWAKLFGKTK